MLVRYILSNRFKPKRILSM